MTTKPNPLVCQCGHPVEDHVLGLMREHCTVCECTDYQPRAVGETYEQRLAKEDIHGRRTLDRMPRKWWLDPHWTQREET